MANSSITMTSLDFDSYKASLKRWLKQQTAYKDYDFEASNMTVLLDLLSYNTYQNAFYMNMVANEMFLDSAQLRESVVSHAKELNYVPRSFRSSSATIGLQVTSANTSKTNVLVPRGTAFVSRIGNQNFIYTTDENVVMTSSNNVFSSEITIYEGDFVTETYAVSYDNPVRYVINNKTVDISSLKVNVIEDSGANVYAYTRATSMFDVTSSSKAFFVQPYKNDSYEIIFGDGVVGRPPKNNSVVIMEYRICNGELANGARSFQAAQTIDGESNTTVTTVAISSGGAVYESIESIKYNAPRSFTTQERAVTAEDYENLLKAYYPEINAVSAYGGEDANPPQYGRVFISVDLNDIDGLPKTKEQEYTKFLKSRSSVALEPIFVSPEYTYLDVATTVKYNINRTSINPQDISTLVMSSILSYADTNLNNFGRTFRYSRFVNAVDNAEASIISNETEVRLIKQVAPVLNKTQNITVDFGVALNDKIPALADLHPTDDVHAVMSSNFTYGGIVCHLEDDGDGLVRIVTREGSFDKAVSAVGTVNYDTGVITLSNFSISDFSGSVMKFYCVPRTKDITVSKNIILNILESDVRIEIEQIRD